MFNNLLKNLLLRVHLNGLISESAMFVKKGVGVISVVDDSNSVLAICSAKIGEKSDDHELGLPSLGVLTKFISDSDDGLDYTIDKKGWLTLKRGKRGGKLKLLLNDPETVSNNVDGGLDNKAGLFEGSPVTLKLTPKIWEILSYYLSLLSGSSGGTMFIEVKKGRITAYSSPDENNQFEIRLGKADDSPDDCSVEIFGKYLEAVLKVADWDLDVMVAFGDDTPVIISQDGEDFESFWAITPLL